MFGLDPMVMGVALLAAISTAGVAYVLMFSRLEAEKKADLRFRKITAGETDRVNLKAARDRMNELSKRRKSVQDSLKDLKKKQKERSARAKPPIKVRLVQAGLSMSVARFGVISAIAGAFVFIAILIASGSFLIA